MRILHLPLNIGGHPFQISWAERQLGQQSDCIVFEDNFGRLANADVFFSPSDSIWKREFKKWGLFFYALKNYDIFHFNFGQKFFPIYIRPFKANENLKQRAIRLLYWFYALLIGKLDLWIPRLLGKKIFMTWQGSDARQADYCRAHYAISFANEVGPEFSDAYADRRKRRSIRLYDFYCRAMFSLNPDLMNMLPKRTRFIPYAHVDLNEWKPVVSNNKKPLIVHAPSNRDVKGTRFLLSAIENLRGRGYDFDFFLVEKTPNAEARKIYEKADILVDQLLAGWYGGLSVELMALGKPVVCYLRPEDLHFVPEEMRKEIPIVPTTPETIEAVLADLLEKKSKWPEIGMRSRRFVEKWHDPHRVAAALIEAYRAES